MVILALRSMSEHIRDLEEDIECAKDDRRIQRIRSLENENCSLKIKNRKLENQISDIAKVLVG